MSRYPHPYPCAYPGGDCMCPGGPLSETEPPDTTNDPPAEVIEVHAAFVKNGEEHFGPNRLGPSYAPVCRIRQERDYPSNQPNGKWLVLPNYENPIPGLVYYNGKWFYRYGYKADEPVAGGKDEALAHVSCYFTG